MTRGFPCIIIVLLSSVLLQATEPAAAFDYTRYMQGRHVYERNCLICHGARGDGNGELAATLKPKPRSFREGLFKFRSTPPGRLPTDDDLRRTITGGLSGTAMGMFAQLPEEDVSAVIAYLKSFSRRWRKPENHAPPMKLPPAPGWMRDPAAMKTHAASGHELFVANCAACHGAKADGSGLAAAALRDAWGQAAAPSDLRQPHPRCGDTAEDLFRVLATGLDGTPMVGFAQTLTEAQRWDIIAHLLMVRLPSPPVLGSAPKAAK